VPIGLFSNAGYVRHHDVAEDSFGLAWIGIQISGDQGERGAAQSSRRDDRTKGSSRSSG